MKPPPLRYSRPGSMAEALALLASLGEDGKVLAGGQSLVPLLYMRLAAPEHLVDINRLAELGYVRVEDGQVRVGALARHAEVLADPAAAAAQPLLARRCASSPTPAIRNRGTTVGSIVHADPAGEMPAVLAVLGRGGAGGRTRAGSGWFRRASSSSGRWSRPCSRASSPPRRCSRCCRRPRAPGSPR